MRVACLALVASILALAPAASFAAEKPPRNAVSLHEEIDPEDGVQVILAFAQLRKASRGRILRVDFRIHFIDLLQFSVTGSAHLRVNGLVVPVTFGSQGSSCNLSLTCFVEGYGWLDLDQAEADQPGLFLGKPLEIELRGTATGQNDARAEVSLLAQLIKR
jgi:hypothetical protein